MASPINPLTLPATSELVGICLTLTPSKDGLLAPHYAKGLHAFFLKQVQNSDPELSKTLHDGESEKPFTLSRLTGPLTSSPQGHQIQKDEPYHWYITGFNQKVLQWLQTWLQAPPSKLTLQRIPFAISDIGISRPAVSYPHLIASKLDQHRPIALSFLSPTSFRRKGQHLPLPWPRNIFQSYLRRWNHFSGQTISAIPFLDWIDESVIILRHNIHTQKVAAGKQGSVTGFLGNVEFGLTSKGRDHQDFSQLFYTLAHLSPYTGTGHKTTFGLGQTRLGWEEHSLSWSPAPQKIELGQRIIELTEQFIGQRKRTGGDRARNIAKIWATILARREAGETVADLAKDLGMPHGTVKTYLKLARRAIREHNQNNPLDGNK